MKFLLFLLFDFFFKDSWSGDIIFKDNVLYLNLTDNGIVTEVNCTEEIVTTTATTTTEFKNGAQRVSINILIILAIFSFLNY